MKRVHRRPERAARGFTLIELLLALALAALITAALGSLTGLLLQSQAQSHALHDLAQQSRFAMTRIGATLRAGSAAVVASTSPQLVVTVGARTVSYAWDSANARLTETDSATGVASVIATRVGAFDATLATRAARPANYGALTSGGSLSSPIAKVTMTVADGAFSIPAAAWARVGGGL